MFPSIVWDVKQKTRMWRHTVPFQQATSPLEFPLSSWILVPNIWILMPNDFWYRELLFHPSQVNELQYPKLRQRGKNTVCRKTEVSELCALGEQQQPAHGSEAGLCPSDAHTCCTDCRDATEPHSTLCWQVLWATGVSAGSATAATEYSVITNNAGLATYDCFRTWKGHCQEARRRGEIRFHKQALHFMQQWADSHGTCRI